MQELLISCDLGPRSGRESLAVAAARRRYRGLSRHHGGGGLAVALAGGGTGSRSSNNIGSGGDSVAVMEVGVSDQEERQGGVQTEGRPKRQPRLPARLAGPEWA